MAIGFYEVIFPKLIDIYQYIKGKSQNKPIIQFLPKQKHGEYEYKNFVLDKGINNFEVEMVVEDLNNLFYDYFYASEHYAHYNNSNSDIEYMAQSYLDYAIYKLFIKGN